MLHVPDLSKTPPSNGRRGRADPTSLKGKSNPTHLSRSPHPYYRHGAGKASTLNGEAEPPSKAHDSAQTVDEDTPYQWHRKRSTTPDDSGSEADDESLTVLKSLPAPPLRPRKGLRDAQSSSSDSVHSPLLPPSAFDGADGSLASRPSSDWSREKDARQFGAEEARRTADKISRRRNAELRRRTVEASLSTGIGLVVLCGDGVWESAWNGHKVNLITHLTLTVLLGLLYIFRLVLWSWRNPISPSRPLQKRIRIPSSFDPAPLFYPNFLPIHVALSLLPSQEKLILPNIILSLSSLPPELIPGPGTFHGFNMVHWAISTIPFAMHHNTPLDREVVVLLYPLHQALCPVLRYLTTTSLLPAELKLLATALVNLLINSASPQSVILKSLLWGGGMSVLILCSPVLRWGVTLARIPRWRFRRAGTVIAASNILRRALEGPGNGSVSSLGSQIANSDADEDEPTMSLNLKQRREGRRPRNNSIGGMAIPTELRATVENYGSAISAKLGISGPQTPRRRNTTPVAAEPVETESRTRKRRWSVIQTYLNMTPAQANLRKWGYALYVYTTVLAIILIGIRSYASRYALNGLEPVGWALGYLLGDNGQFRLWVVSNNLESWIALPARARKEEVCQYRSLAQVRHSTLGEANSRLAICGYCLAALVSGLCIVSRLSQVFEVDSRRKVFHGMMVVMFLPSIIVDPLFASLALSLVLAMFLLLDLFRASQLPPLSMPISRFLAPYVDGRDLRGPVVVSHIFLLIGCAIPLWLSLAAVPRTGRAPWKGWEVEARDMSMVAGVVCVGMGDAAASLVGRRYGRHKWFWSGGKSLEGSAAFAVAVAVGLAGGKAWGLAGGWLGPGGGAGITAGITAEITAERGSLTKGFGAGRMLAAGAGASLMEAVLTGGNDNVMVPVVLWLLVRGLAI